MPDQLCSYLDWDSDFFGVRIARYCGDELTADAAASALDWCRRQAIDCLYVLVRDDPRDIAVAEQLGLLHVDTRMTLSRTLADYSSKAAATGIRPAEQADVPTLRAIARCGHHDSRFYHDPHFPRNICDGFYETWIERSCLGWADKVLVVEAGRCPIGYITCHASPDAEGSIGLVAVGGQHRGSGFGGQLIAGALDYFRDRGINRVRVVTQERNREGLHLYQRRGFSIESRGNYYHAWIAERGGL